jgi:hypothetical protein
MNYDRFTKMVNNLNIARRKKDLDLEDYKRLIDNFINGFGLLDFRDFREAPQQAA